MRRIDYIKLGFAKFFCLFNYFCFLRTVIVLIFNSFSIVQVKFSSIFSVRFLFLDHERHICMPATVSSAMRKMVATI